MLNTLYAPSSAVILSAGNSIRMGEHKAMLLFKDGVTFMERICKTYIQAGVEQVIVVVTSELHEMIKTRIHLFPEKLKVIINKQPELGRFYSWQTGLSAIQKGHFCFFQNIDNPFTSPELVITLYNYRNKADVIIPDYNGKTGHPVLVSPKVVAEILKFTDTEKHINQVIKTFSTYRLQTKDKHILVNINTRQEYLRLMAGD